MLLWASITQLDQRQSFFQAVVSVLHCTLSQTQPSTDFFESLVSSQRLLTLANKAGRSSLIIFFFPSPSL